MSVQWDNPYLFDILFQLPAVYDPLFDAISAISEESCIFLENLYQTQGVLHFFFPL